MAELFQKPCCLQQIPARRKGAACQLWRLDRAVRAWWWPQLHLLQRERVESGRGALSHLFLFSGQSVEGGLRLKYTRTL